MSNAGWIFSGMVWLSLVMVALSFVVLHAPKKRKMTDELEAMIAALKNRLVDLEDKHESFVKREAVRNMRARQDGAPATPVDIRAELRAKAAQMWGRR